MMPQLWTMTRPQVWPTDEFGEMPDRKRTGPLPLPEKRFVEHQ
jgi:hypothetical protein